METLVRLFRRETSSQNFIPVIDGLRFLAIAMVVFFHTNGFIYDKLPSVTFTSDSLGSTIPNFLIYGDQGVHLFFVISGFILAVPFMRHYLLNSGKKSQLKPYFIRRLTRLEPPYIIACILIFLMLVFVSDKYPLNTLTASLFYSLFYVHTFATPGISPYINHVTWSLEVEVQYYIVAPFIVRLLCLMKSATVRRIILLICMIGASCLAWFLMVQVQVKTVSLIFFLQYFLSGILLCDIFLVDSEKLEKLRSPWFFIPGLALLVVIVSFHHAESPNLVIRILSPLMIFAFYLIVFGNKLWHRVFSLTGLTLIGGMCYSIYLLHITIISAVGRVTYTKLYVSDFTIFYWIQTPIYIVAILVISAVYFLLIEKPCMKPDWHIRLYRKFKPLT